MPRNRRYRYNDVKVDSKWEAKLYSGVLADVEYHSVKVSYSVDHDYTPDWVHGRILIEAKGRFRERSEASKYTWIRKALATNPLYDELVFLFMNPKTPMPNAKPRKDGTKQSHAEWAEKNGFRWYTEYNINELIGK